MPQAIAQTTDGYLWIGTSAGLLRFNGISFVPWRTPLQYAEVRSLLASSDGSLWIGGSKEMAHLQNGVVTSQAGPLGRFDDILQDHRGTVWAVRERSPDLSGALCEAHGTQLTCTGNNVSNSCKYASSLVEDTSGTLWGAGEVSLCSWTRRPGKPLAISSIPSTGNIQTMLAEPDGSLLVGFADKGAGMDLERFSSGKFTPVKLTGFDNKPLSVVSLLGDKDGGLWIGTDVNGLYHVEHGAVDHFGSADGLTGDSVQKIFQDREGNIWVATSEGLDQFHRIAVTSFSIKQGLTSGQMFSVLGSRGGAVYAGVPGAVQILDGGKVTALLPKGLPSTDFGRSLAEDPSGALWIGFGKGLVRYHDGKFDTVRSANGKPLGDLQAMAVDKDGIVWASDPRFGFYRIDRNLVATKIDIPAAVNSVAIDLSGDVWLSANGENIFHHHNARFEPIGPPPGKVRLFDMIFDGPNSFWAASRNGLYRYRNGLWKVISVKDGLPCAEISSMVQDQDDALWLDLRCGFVELTRNTLEHWQNHSTEILNPKVIGAAEGFRPGFSTFSPVATKSADGHLWFANDAALQMIDPHQLNENIFPPPVHIEQLIADHKLYPVTSDVQLPALTHDIAIDYTALSFVLPKAVHFRYRLSGIDKTWQDVDTRRQAFYMNLPPGHYLFQVIACNNDGVWNETGAQLRFAIRPALYQTMWFRMLSVAAALLFLFILFRVRLRNATAIVESRLGERLLERERIARELHDTLLQGFQALLLNLHMVIAEIPEGELGKTSILSFLEQGDKTLLEGRERVRDLRSHEHSVVDLADLIERVIVQFRTYSEPLLSLSVSGKPRVVSLVVAEEATLFVREAMNNAIRHAKASHVNCEIHFERGELRVLVEDDGLGIPAGALRPGGNSGHWGLIGMKERAKKLDGKLKIVTGSTGTHIELCIPQRVAFSTGETRLLEKLKSLFFPLR